MPQESQRQPLTNDELRALFLNPNPVDRRGNPISSETIAAAERRLPPEARRRLATMRQEDSASFLDRAMGMAQSAGIGALKAGGRMIVEGSDLATRPLRALGVPVPPAEAFDEARARMSPPEESVIESPDTKAEQAAFTLANMLAVLAPGGQIARGRAAATRALQPSLGRGASVVGPAAVEAATGAAQAALQGGDPFTTAAISGMIPVAGAVTRPIGQRLRSAAESDLVQSLRPRGLEGKVGARRISGEFLERQRTGNVPTVISNDELLDLSRTRAGVAREASESLADDVLATRPFSKTAPILSELDQHIADLSIVNRATGAIIRPLDRQKARILQGLREHIAGFGEEIDQVALRSLRTQIGKIAKRKGAFRQSEQVQAEVFDIGYNAVRRVLHEHNPDLAKLDKELSFWLTIKDILSKGALQETGQQSQLASAGIFALAGASAGAAFGADLGNAGTSLGIGTGAFLGANIGRRIAMAWRSPLWQRVVGRSKDNLARAIMGGNANQVEAALTRIVAVEFPKVARQSSEPAHDETSPR